MWIELGAESAFQVGQCYQPITSRGNTPGFGSHIIVRIAASLASRFGFEGEELVAEPLERHACCLTPGEQAVGVGHCMQITWNAALRVKKRGG